jgi:hypothetical protein
MSEPWLFNRNLKCKCDLPIGTCANIECPHSLSSHDSKGFYDEGWALSKYSVEAYKKTRVGALVKKIKYDKSNSYTLKSRTEDARIISIEMINLLKLLYNPSNLPFDYCVCPPSHDSKPLDLPEFICKSISGGSVQFLNNAIIEKEPLSTIKQLAKEERSAKLVDNFLFDIFERVLRPKGFLVIDDVFDTGSTIKGVCRAIKTQYPQLPIFVLTAAYIGHMGRISAV